MDVSKLSIDDNIEVYKQKVLVSCHNVLAVAQNAISKHPKIKKVIILEHAPRFDMNDVDPQEIKPKLAKYANQTLSDLMKSSPVKDKIQIGKHNPHCEGDQIAARYRDDRTGRYDGVHMYNSLGKNVYTRSLLDILKTVIPIPHKASVSSSSYHTTCPTTQYHNTQKRNINSRSHNEYSVPVHNQFDVLGN